MLPDKNTKRWKTTVVFFLNSIIAGVISSALVSYLAYNLLKQNLSAFINTGFEIVKVDETIGALNAIANRDFKASRLSYQPDNSLQLVTQKLSLLEANIGEGSQKLQELAQTFEKLYLPRGPGEVSPGQLVSDPKVAFLNQLRTSREQLSSLLVNIKETSGLAAVAHGTRLDGMKQASDQCDLTTESIKQEVKEAALALDARRLTMLKVLKEFGPQ